MRKFILLLILIFVVAAYYLLKPIPINQVAPPEVGPAPAMVGVLAPNDALSQAQAYGPVLSPGPEDITFDQEGNLYTGTSNGSLYRISADAKQAEVIANVMGRPLGLHFDANDLLYIANAGRGLVTIDKRGDLLSLVSRINDQRLMLTEEITIANDGKIYFTDSSTRFHVKNSLYILFDEPRGRLIEYEPTTKETKLLAGNIHFANGLTMSHDQGSILVCESATRKIWRYWVNGDKKGMFEVFNDSLPGVPENISPGSNGLYWVALSSLRDTDKLFESRLLSRLAIRLPNPIFELFDRGTSAILALNAEGKIVHYLEDKSKALAHVTSVVERDGWLYLGTLYGKQVHRVKVPK